MAEPIIKARLVLNTEGSGSSGGGLNGSIGIGGKDLFGGLAKIIAILAPIKEILQTAFGSLLKTVGGLLKMIGLILKPVGDILAIGILPLIYMLRPLTRIINILFGPYLRAAMTAFAAGNKLMGKGDIGGASKAFGLGFMALMKPFLDMGLFVMNILLQGLTNLLEIAITPLVVGLGYLVEIFSLGKITAEDLVGTMEAGFNIAREGIDFFFGLLIDFTNIKLFGAISDVAASAGIQISNFSSIASISFSSLGHEFTKMNNDMMNEIVGNLAAFMGLSKTAIDNTRNAVETLIKATINFEQIAKDFLNNVGRVGGGRTSKYVSKGILDVGQNLSGQMGFSDDALINTYKALSYSDKLAKSGGLATGSGFLGLGGGSAAGDFLVRNDGTSMKFSPDDNVIGVKDMGKLSGKTVINVSINALDVSSINRSVIDRLALEIGNKLKRDLSGRSSYGVGY